MSIVQANGIDIKVEEYGPSDGTPLILVCGWSVQLTFWPKALIDRFTDAGFRVIIFDNRDVGFSQKTRSHITTYPLAPHIMASRFLRRKIGVAYTLEDMASDTIGVMDALHIDKAHVLGISMGGMITQIIAAQYPHRVETATILMSSTNRFGLPQPPLNLTADVFLSRRPRSVKSSAKKSLRVWKQIRTKDGGYPENDLESMVSASIDRTHYPAGRRRQLEAIMATGDLRRFARRITVPSLVIHGSADILARPYGGLDIAANIRGAKFELIEGLGHDLPPSKLDQIADLTIAHANSRRKSKPRLRRVA